MNTVLLLVLYYSREQRKAGPVIIEGRFDESQPTSVIGYQLSPDIIPTQVPSDNPLCRPLTSLT